MGNSIMNFDYTTLWDSHSLVETMIRGHTWLYRNDLTYCYPVCANTAAAFDELNDSTIRFATGSWDLSLVGSKAINQTLPHTRWNVGHWARKRSSSKERSQSVWRSWQLWVGVRFRNQPQTKRTCNRHTHTYT